MRERPDIRSKLEQRRDAMRDAVPGWEVEAAGFEPLMASLELPDPNDVHVLAAAIAGRVDCIVTANLRDFPTGVLAAHGVEVIHPDDFLVYQLDLEPYTALAAFKGMRQRLRNPALSPEQFAAALERHLLAATAQRLREASELI